MKKTKWSIGLGLFFSILFASFSTGTTQAQNIENKNYYFEESFCDNMFIYGGAGINLFITGDVANATKDQHPLTVAGSFGAGKWLSPYYGLRLEITGAPVKVFDDAGQRYSRGYLGFYGDFMWNVLNTFSGYNEHRVVDVIPFAGISFMTMLEKINNDGRDRVPFSFPMSVGVNLNFRLNHYFDFYLQARFSGTSDNFDNRIAPRKIEPMLTTTAGVVWKIGKNRFQTYNPYDEMMVRASLNEKVNVLRADLNACLANEPEVREIISVTDCPESTLTSVVRFRINSAIIARDQQVNVYSAAQWMKMNPEQIIEVVGYADADTGTAEYNMDLSMRRAQAVADELMETYGIPANKLKVVAKGSMEQPYPEHNDWNRVVIFIGDDF